MGLTDSLNAAGSGHENQVRDGIDSIGDRSTRTQDFLKLRVDNSNASSEA